MMFRIDSLTDGTIIYTFSTGNGTGDVSSFSYKKIDREYVLVEKYNDERSERRKEYFPFLEPIQ